MIAIYQQGINALTVILNVYIVHTVVSCIVSCQSFIFYAKKKIRRLKCLCLEEGKCNSALVKIIKLTVVSHHIDLEYFHAVPPHAVSLSV